MTLYTYTCTVKEIQWTDWLRNTLFTFKCERFAQIDWLFTDARGRLRSKSTPTISPEIREQLKGIHGCDITYICFFVVIIVIYHILFMFLFTFTHVN